MKRTLLTALPHFRLGGLTRSPRLFFVLFLILTSSQSSFAQEGFSVHSGSTANEIVLNARVDYGAILAPLHVYKKTQQEKLNLSSGCDQPGRYFCDEYPFGVLSGNDKFLMRETSPGNWAHFGVEYEDKRTKRYMEIPLQLSRHFPTTPFSFTDGQGHPVYLLNLDQDGPGAKPRAFDITRQAFGDTLIQIQPEAVAGKIGRLTTTVCQIQPGGSLTNPVFKGTYTYFYKKIFGKKISMSADFEGYLGGIKFDALRACVLLKTELDQGKVLTSTLDISPPVFVNAQRIPVKIRLSAASWLEALIFGLILAAIISLFPFLLTQILAIIIAVIAVVLTALAANGNLISKEINKYVDKMIESKTGITLKDLDSEVYATKLKLDQLDQGNSLNQSAFGDFKNGGWAASISHQLLSQQKTLAHAAAKVYLEKYFAKLALPFDRLKAACDGAATKIANGASTTQGGAQQRSSKLSDPKLRASLGQEMKNLCNRLNETTVKFEFFQPIPQSESVGCYRSFARLEEIKDRNVALASHLKTKLTSSSGGVFHDVVAAAIDSRLSEATFMQAGNWWATQSSEKFCGFDNRIRITYPRISQSRYVACLIQQVRKAVDANEDPTDGIVQNCSFDINGLE